MSPIVQLCSSLALVALAILFATRRSSVLAWHLPAIVAAAALPIAAAVPETARTLISGFEDVSVATGGGVAEIRELVHQAQQTLREGAFASVAILVLGLLAAVLAAGKHADGEGVILVPSTSVPERAGALLLGLAMAGFLGALLLVLVQRSTLRLVQHMLEPGPIVLSEELSRRLALHLGVETMGGLAVCALLGVAFVGWVLTPSPRVVAYKLIAWGRVLAALALLSFGVQAMGLRADARAPWPTPVATQPQALPPRAVERERPVDSQASVAPLVPGADAPLVPGAGSGVSPPKILSQVSPKYPAVARAARLEEVVILEAVIGTDGVVEDVKTLRGSQVFADAAIEAVRKWRFEPGRKDGRPVRVIFTLTVDFTLK